MSKRGKLTSRKIKRGKLSPKKGELRLKKPNKIKRPPRGKPAKKGNKLA